MMNWFAPFTEHRYMSGDDLRLFAIGMRRLQRLFRASRARRPSDGDDGVVVDETGAAALRIAQYAYNTRHRGVKFTRTTDVSELLSVRAFADASFLDCPDTARSTGGYCVFFCGNLIAFESKRLPLVTLSTAESEYVEATRCATEVAYIKELCRDFNIDLDTVPIMEDNTACIAISANPVHHQRTKHIAKYYHYCRDMVLAGEIELVGVGTKYQVADIFTKPLERDTFRRLSSVLNGYRSYAQLLVDAPTASIATMLQKTSDYANQVYHSLADHDLARYV